MSHRPHSAALLSQAVLLLPSSVSFEALMAVIPAQIPFMLSFHFSVNSLGSACLNTHCT